MRPWGRIRRRLALAIVLTALLPMLVAIGLVETTVRQTSARFFVPEVGQRLDQSLELYQELADAIKASMRTRATAMALDPALREAVEAGDVGAARGHLERYLQVYDDAVSLVVVDAEGEVFVSVDRGAPVDANTEKQLTVRRTLGGHPGPEEAEGLDGLDGEGPGAQGPGATGPEATGPEATGPEAEGGPDAQTPDAKRSDAERDPVEGALEGKEGEHPAGLQGEPPPGFFDDLTSPPRHELHAVFATARAPFDEHHEMSGFVDTYRRIEQRREADEQSYVFAFAALLGITILAAIGMGVFLAQGVSRRIGELARATRQVGAGDLRVRVNEGGSDELADLARAFNRMVAEVESSRARIEYLQHIGAWQEMARRLAHEIKNPLTPIQLAVQEVERRYGGEDAGFRRLLQTTREIVEDEVGTLRRLVSEFSGFARLPRAELEPGDLAELLRQQAARLRLGSDDPEASPAESTGRLPAHVHLELDVPQAEAPAYLDRQMLGRVLANLTRNAVEVLSEGVPPGSGGEEGARPGGAAGRRLGLRLSREGDYWMVDVDDDGPGIEPERRGAVFDPYVTTKLDGTGLGLAIVKKIVVEHGGLVSAETSPWGGARIRVRLPVLGTPSSEAALEASRFEPTPPRASASLRRAAPLTSNIP
ncbi:MAG: HAMP domain-containing protein [Myxococcales bacterium]|nr:HAMP domain-containing protein [Myxococcales bacterium]